MIINVNRVDYNEIFELIRQIIEFKDDISIDNDIYLKLKELSPHNRDFLRKFSIFINSLSIETKDLIVEALNENFIELFNNLSLNPHSLNEIQNETEKTQIKVFFEYCYTSILDKKLREHFAFLFLKKNLKVCPICTLKNFEAADTNFEDREPYEHFLPKEKYPWFYLDMRNLIPICDKCNRKKLTKDPLYNSSGRRLSLFPYHNKIILLINSENFEAENISITLESDDSEYQQSLNTIIELYDLKKRFEKTFEAYRTEWYGNIIYKLKQKNLTVVEEIKNELELMIISQLKQSSCKINVLLETAYIKSQKDNPKRLKALISSINASNECN